MGEAKRRGSTEERTAEAIEREKARLAVRKDHPPPAASKTSKSISTLLAAALMAAAAPITGHAGPPSFPIGTTKHSQKK